MNNASGQVDGSGQKWTEVDESGQVDALVDSGREWTVDSGRKWTVDSASGQVDPLHLSFYLSNIFLLFSLFLPFLPSPCLCVFASLR